MNKIDLKEYIDAINGWLVNNDQSKLQPQEEKFIIKNLQEIEDEQVSYMGLDQLRVLIAIEAVKMGSIVRLGGLSIDEMEIELEKISRDAVEAKRKYLQII